MSDESTVQMLYMFNHGIRGLLFHYHFKVLYSMASSFQNTSLNGLESIAEGMSKRPKQHITKPLNVLKSFLLKNIRLKKGKKSNQTLDLSLRFFCCSTFHWSFQYPHSVI